MNSIATSMNRHLEEWSSLVLMKTAIVLLKIIHIVYIKIYNILSIYGIYLKIHNKIKINLMLYSERLYKNGEELLSLGENVRILTFLSLIQMLMCSLWF